MSEVACSAVAPVLRALEERGVAAAALVAGTCLDVEVLRNPRQRISWDDFAALLDRAEELTGGPEGLVAIGEGVVETTELGPLTPSLGVFLTPRSAGPQSSRLMVAWPPRAV